MRTLRLFLSAVCLALVSVSGASNLTVWAQEASEIPPLPRPRPERDASGTPVPAPIPAPAPETRSNASSPAISAIDSATSAPQPVTLSAQITQDGTVIPEGLVWRVFDSVPDANGEMALVAKEEAGTAHLQLPPGEYVIHLSYGRAQTSEPLSVGVGENSKNIVMEAGALRLNSAVKGDIPIQPSLLKFDIFTAGPENSRTVVAENLLPNEIITLNAGTYHIVSRFGDINAVVRADLRVEPGQLTDATLYHHGSEISFKLVSEEGGEAIADVEWTVKSTDGTTLFTDRGAFPWTVLAEGDYLVLAKLGDQVYNREFQVQPGGAREIEILNTMF